ncbi:MAG: PadR family transcriptional regulator [Acidobacteriota bacterium]|nr:PadR family transcriptional regulator [Acidobacteriota bacterium]
MMKERMMQFHERWGGEPGGREVFGGREGYGPGREKLDYWEIPNRDGRASNCRRQGGTCTADCRECPERSAAGRSCAEHEAEDRGEERRGRHPHHHHHGGFEGHFMAHMRGGFRGMFGHGFGHGRERLFDAGDLKLVILKLLSEEPSYGYQLIKTMEERLAGGYTPSAGVVYPTLTLLEEEGLAAANVENGKKVYSATAEGLQYLAANKRRVDQLFERLEEAKKGFARGRSPEMMKAFMNLRGAVMARVTRESVTAEQIKEITKIINAAASAIDEM